MKIYEDYKSLYEEKNEEIKKEEDIKNPTIYEKITSFYVPLYISSLEEAVDTEVVTKGKTTIYRDKRGNIVKASDKDKEGIKKEVIEVPQYSIKGWDKEKLKDWFPNKDRIFVPFKIEMSEKDLNDEIKKWEEFIVTKIKEFPSFGEMKKILEKEGYKINKNEDILNNTASQTVSFKNPETGKEGTKERSKGIGSILADLQKKYKNSGDTEKTNEIELLNKKFTKSRTILFNSNLKPTKDVKYFAVISRHPYDILGMSTDRQRWDSCKTMADVPCIVRGGGYKWHGENKHFLPYEINNILVAYIIPESDSKENLMKVYKAKVEVAKEKEISDTDSDTVKKEKEEKIKDQAKKSNPNLDPLRNPIGRLTILPMFNEQGEMYYFLQTGQVYGLERNVAPDVLALPSREKIAKEFKKTVNDWLLSKQGEVPGDFHVSPVIYNDGYTHEYVKGKKVSSLNFNDKFGTTLRFAEQEDIIDALEDNSKKFEDIDKIVQKGFEGIGHIVILKDNEKYVFFKDEDDIASLFEKEIKKRLSNKNFFEETIKKLPLQKLLSFINYDMLKKELETSVEEHIEKLKAQPAKIEHYENMLQQVMEHEEGIHYDDDYKFSWKQHISALDDNKILDISKKLMGEETIIDKIKTEPKYIKEEKFIDWYKESADYAVVLGNGPENSKTQSKGDMTYFRLYDK